MKLLNVYASNAVWGKLIQCKMQPKMAYAILKYVQLVEAEHLIIEKTRVALIHELTNTKEGESAEVKPGTEAHLAYVKRFGDMLNVESDLQQSALKFDDLISGPQDQGNVLSAQEIGLLEPFFTT